MMHKPLEAIHAPNRENLCNGSGYFSPTETAALNNVYSCLLYTSDADGKSYPKSEQVARCGNAVCPPIPTALVRANLPEMCVSAKTA